MRASDPETQTSALISIGDGADIEIQRLVSDLMWRDPSATVRHEAAKTLARVNSAWGREELGRCGADCPTTRTRLAAIEALGNIRGPDSQRLLISLWALDRSRDDGVAAIGVSEALANHGADALDELLAAALSDRAPTVRVAAANSLKRLDGPALRERLGLAAKSDNSSVRASAAEILKILYRPGD
ncbi:MAG: HEAT repeat domain-containing protein [Deltaproteobacteria bacterium]|nr:HEAT repeat domain-containing protein [Deltaproteobacteria bacterium]